MQNDLISRSESYMNDLIRRKDVLALFPTNDCSDKMIGLYERVLDIPTAYDVEKVVANVHEYFKTVIDDSETVEIPKEVLSYNKNICAIIRNGGKE